MHILSLGNTGLCLSCSVFPAASRALPVLAPDGTGELRGLIVHPHTLMWFRGRACGALHPCGYSKEKSCIAHSSGLSTILFFLPYSVFSHVFSQKIPFFFIFLFIPL